MCRCSCGGVGVGGGFQGAPVLTSGDGDRVDAIHDSFVVRRRAVGVVCGHLPRFYDPASNLGPTESFVRQLQWRGSGLIHAPRQVELNVHRHVWS